MKYKLLFFIVIASCNNITTSEPKIDQPFWYTLLDIVPHKLVRAFDWVTPTAPSWNIKQSETASNKEIDAFLRHKNNNQTETELLDPGQNNEDKKNPSIFISSLLEKIGIALGGAVVIGLGMYAQTKKSA